MLDEQGFCPGVSRASDISSSLSESNASSRLVTSHDKGDPPLIWNLSDLGPGFLCIEEECFES